MAVNPFKLTVHMVSSVDGYIAKRDNSVSWFETTDYFVNGVAENNAQEILSTIDCYIMGSHTYELALELSKSYGWVYGDVPTIVLTHRELPIHKTNIEIYKGDLCQLVNDRLKPVYQNVWVVGGASLVKDFIRLNLVDEIRQSILPILLGNGLPFYHQIGVESPLHLHQVTAFKTGLIELTYQIKK